MLTIIDSLIITLGLDPSDLNKGQKEVADAFLKTQEAAVASGKKIEESAKKAGDSIGKVTFKVLELFAVLLGARSVIDFATNITKTDAALGYFSTNLGESVQTVSEWQMAAERMGGSASATASTLERVGQALYDLRRNGQMLPKEFLQLEAATGQTFDTNDGTSKFLIDVARAAHQLAQTDPSRAHFLLKGAGIDDATANAMIKYGDAFDKYLQSMNKYAVSDSTVKAMQNLVSEFAALQQEVSKFVTTLLGDLEPELTKIIKEFSDWLDAPGNLKDVEKNFADFAQSLPPMIDNLGKVANVVNDIAKAFGGWGNALTALLAIWAGAKTAGLIMGLINIGKALGLGAAAGAEGAGGAAVGVAGAIAGAGIGGAVGLAGAGVLATTGPAGAGEGDVVRGFNSGASAHGYTPGSYYNPATGTWSGGVPPPVSGTTRGWWTPERQAHAYAVLRQKAGLSDAGARGLISRWMNVESPAGPTSSNDIGGGHYGIAQWGMGRGTGIWGDSNFDDQLGHVVNELNGRESAAGNALRSARTNLQGATGASMYERGEGYSGRTHTDNFTARTAAGMDAVATAANSAANALKWARVSSVHNNSRNSSIHTTIGDVHVHVPNGDPKTIANGVTPALKRGAMAWAMNYGPA
ncbi:MAG: hypothetical protein KGL35_24400 [Bradyrhizobium sp.]|nr:hypothetical protein [Bradyrhizobium sp.]